MNPISCGVIRDLLPLYAEKLAGPESQTLIEEHLAVCSDCCAVLDDLKTPAQATAEVPLLQVRRKLRKKRYLTVLLAVSLSMLLLLSAFSHLTAPLTSAVVPDNSVLVDITGRVVLAFSTPKATNCRVEYYTEEEGHYAVVTAWTTHLDQLLKADTATTTLDSSVDAVYYAYDGTRPAHLIYGRDLFQGGGFMVLPRLTLGYYVLLSAAAAVVLGLAALFFRKTRSGIVLRTIFLMPCSWLIGHLCIKGASTVSYFAVRDFLFILPAAAAAFGAMWAGLQLLQGFVRSAPH